MYAVHLSNIKYGQTSTPLSYHKDNPKPPSRKLWQKENVCPNNYIVQSFDYSPPSMESWDKIQSPQYVNFFNGISESRTADTFFDEDRNENVIKPQSPKVQKLPGTEGDIPLLNALLNCSLSKVKIEDNSQLPANKPITYKETKACTFSKHVKIKDEKKSDRDKFQRFPSTPFHFDGKDKCKVERKQDRNNKHEVQGNLKQPMFRANPVPKFIRTNAASIFGRVTSAKTEEKKTDEKPVRKTEEKKPDEKPVRKMEIWKKEPFRPCPATKTLAKARTPKLSTASRALQRKRFDERMKEKERQLELAKQQEESAKKKQEDVEIARLRKLSVHKAQPIRTYKSGLPEVQKRPLTDPISPLLSFKRRRCV